MQNIIKISKNNRNTFSYIEGQRQLIFKPLKKLSTKILGALRGAQAPTTVITDAETINRKIQGKRADNSIEETPAGTTPKNKISVSQQSFDMQVDHFDKLITLVDLEPNYNLNEIPLQVITLTDYKTQLDTINTEVKDAYIPYNNAMKARDKKLYDPETGLVAIAQVVKNYVKSIYGALSPEYKQINKLRFKTIVS